MELFLDGQEVQELTKDGTTDMNGRRAIRSTTGSWKSAKFIFLAQFWTYLGYWGVGSNLVIYLNTVLHVGNASASNIVSNWNGATYIAPVIGAVLADSHWGRYWCSLVFTGIFIWTDNVVIARMKFLDMMIGEILITVSAIVPFLTPSQCERQDYTCEQASRLQMGVFFVAVYFIALGTGGVLSSMTAFGADQFDDEDEHEKRQKSSFFNWLYQSGNLGYLVSATLFVYIQNHVSWRLGYGICAVSAVFSLLFFVAGMPVYRNHKLVSNPFTRLARVCVASFHKWRLPTPTADELCEKYNLESSVNVRSIAHTSEFKFLDKAAIECPELDTLKDGVKLNEWRLCTVTQVEELKCMLRMMPIFITTVLYSTVYTQMATLFPIQGEAMDQQFGRLQMSPATVGVFEGVTVIVVIILYDNVMVPFLRKTTGHPKGMSELRRVSVGLALSIVAMVVAALVEAKRLSMARDYSILDYPNSSGVVPVSIFWQVPSYVIIGVSETFTYIGMTEFSYEQSPDNLHTVGTAFFVVTQAAGSFLSTVLVSAVNSATKKQGKWIPDDINQGHVDRFFWLLAALSFGNLAAFAFCAHRYTYMVHPLSESDEIAKTITQESVGADAKVLKRETLID